MSSVTTYARYTTALKHSSAGAAPAYDTALTAGLFTIVSAEWPGEEWERPGRAKSASGLLGVIESRVPPVSGVSLIDPAGFPTEVAGDVFRRFLARTQPHRHQGIGDGEITEDELEALEALGSHVSLVGTLHSERIERYWDNVHGADAIEFARALGYLDDLSEEEIERRIPLAMGKMPMDPKDRLEWIEPQDCPVCGNATVVVERIDDFGYGFGSGTCVVCSYQLSYDIAEDRAIDFALEQHADD